MLNDKMQKALNDQINAEFWSAYLYLSMSAWFANKNLPGFANWMYVQFQEEQTHAIKLFRYVHSRGGAVTLQPIDKVAVSWKSPSDVFKNTLEHEQKVTAMINHLMDIAIELKDHATQSFLLWFVDEQVEEETNANDILQTLLAIEGTPGALRMYDKEFESRVFVDATGASGE
jgi:ferritin